MSIILAVDIGGLFQTALAVVALATAAGLGLMRVNVTTLRESLKDARDEIADKDRRLKDCENKALIAEERAKSFQTDLDALSRVVTGEAHLVALENQLVDHNQRAMDGIDKMLGVLEHIVELLQAQEKKS